MSRIHNFGAGAIILYRAPNGKRYALVQQRAANDEYEPLSWSIFGGGREPGETPDECMLREVVEESGIDLRRYNKVLAYTHVEPHGEFAFYNYAVKIDRPLKPLLNEETKEARWIELGDTPDTLWKNLPTSGPLHSGMANMMRNRTAAEIIDMVA